MQPFNQLTTTATPLRRESVDTDQIIPARYLTAVTKAGMGDGLFSWWRYGRDGKPNPDFELNKPEYTGSQVLIAGRNFGSGSSREHAVWALVQDGYRVIIAPWKEAGGRRLPAFADIFRINATKNGLLLIELSEDQVNQVFELVRVHSGLEATVDLVKQQVAFHGTRPKVFSFDIEAGARKQLMEGLDDIDQTLQYESDITRFEKNHDPLGP